MTNNHASLERLGLLRNPFPPATTGASAGGDVSPPQSWQSALKAHVRQLATSEGEKILAIEGGYGSGKTFLLRWIESEVLPEHRVKPFFFENPGVSFYDLANTLMRQVGRYEFSKALWEMLGPSLASDALQQPLIQRNFPQWLATVKARAPREAAIQGLSQALGREGFATDAEILNKLSKLIVETGERPYFEYRDFVPRSSQSLVAEREEPGYFRALVRMLLAVWDAGGIAFLIDEFEDVALDRRLGRRQTAEYIATLRRLMDAARDEELWVILSATPEGLDRTRSLDPSFAQRLSDTFKIPGLSEDEARTLVADRLKPARSAGGAGISPFAEDALTSLRETTRSSPRRLIKVMWHSIGLAPGAGRISALVCRSGA